MAGVCAVCLQPIAQGGKFVVIETEVAHSRCALSGRRTQGQQQRQRLADLALEIAHANNLAQQAAMAERTARETVQRHQRKIAQFERDVREDRVEAQRVKRMRDDREDVYQASIARLTAHVAELEARVAVVQQAAPQAEQPQSDDSATRFSLLEFQ